jgi:hypothetical protein
MSGELEDFEWMLAATGLPGQMRKIVERERAKMGENLGTLENTIAAHAAMLADKEWNNEHKPILMNLWTHFELAFPTQGGDLTQVGTLEVDGREIPVESITKALHERFMERRKKTLAKKLTERLVADAGRNVLDDEDKPKGDQ